MNQDFATLYRQLELDPDCSLEELRRAYRRRIGRLHPDRYGKDSAPVAQHSEELALPELTWLYTLAIRFHRRHGRLPGAIGLSPSPHHADRWRHSALVTHPQPPPRARKNSRRATMLAILMVLLVVALMGLLE